MSLFNKIFTHKNKTHHVDPLKKAQEISILIEKNANDIFSKFYPVMLNKDNDFIVFSVWGARQSGELTDVQKEIGKDVAGLIDNILESLKIGTQNDELKFCIGYLVRDSLISKLIYMIEYLKFRLGENKTKYNKIVNGIDFDMGNKKKSGESDDLWNIFKNRPEGPGRRW